MLGDGGAWGKQVPGQGSVAVPLACRGPRRLFFDAFGALGGGGGGGGGGGNGGGTRRRATSSFWELENFIVPLGSGAGLPPAPTLLSSPILKRPPPHLPPQSPPPKPTLSLKEARTAAIAAREAAVASTRAAAAARAAAGAAKEAAVAATGEAGVATSAALGVRAASAGSSAVEGDGAARHPSHAAVTEWRRVLCGAVVTQPVGLVDLAATFLAVAGAKRYVRKKQTPMVS